MTHQEYAALSKDELKAYHEAGHVVAHCALDVQFTDVNIDSGEVRYPQPNQSQLVQHIICTLAGPAASERIGDEPGVVAKDEYQAMMLADQWFTDKDATLTFFCGLYEAARAMMREPSFWMAVEALVQELLERRAMNASEVLNFFRRRDLLDTDRLSWANPAPL